VNQTLRDRAGRRPRPMGRQRWRGLITSLLAASLSSCTAARAPATRTPVVAGPTEPLLLATAAAPTPTLEPFRIDLPAQHAPPITGWRPPLYPIPWAVSPYDHFYFARPIAADQVNWPLANYRYGGVFFANVVHTGVDIDAPYGTRILAAGPGTVVWADWGLFLEAPGDMSDPYGQAVVLRMDFGYKNEPLYSVYAHMSKILAVPGQHVQTGDVLGLVGATGATTGPHVHFEVRWAENSFQHTYNPELWMAPPEGWGVLVGRIADKYNHPLHQLEVTVTNTTSGESHVVRTYGAGAANSDPYYQEDVVLGDLAAGLYKITFRADDADEQEWMYIYPGQVTYFTFRTTEGFHIGPPVEPTAGDLPTISAP
jgi:murein DD-endopeptidase MepM/ murein hydrolase activator NlpD